MAGPEVLDNPRRSRYEVLVDGRVVGFADYHEGDGAVVLPHTVVDPAYRGQGLAAVLVGRVLDDLVAAGRTVVPSCSYVARYLHQHPDISAALGRP